MTASEWIEYLKLTEHPEGGWFRETYRSEETIQKECLPSQFSGARAFATSIYFLLTSDRFSSLHRIQSDEIWHFYAGTPLTVHILSDEGKAQTLLLGTDPTMGQQFQAVVPAGCWFGATVDAPDAYALVGCTVSPGFDFADFELADRTNLMAHYPHAQELIHRLTR